MRMLISRTRSDRLEIIIECRKFARQEGEYSYTCIAILGSHMGQKSLCGTAANWKRSSTLETPDVNEFLISQESK